MAGSRLGLAKLAWRRLPKSCCVAGFSNLLRGENAEGSRKLRTGLPDLEIGPIQQVLENLRLRLAARVSRLALLVDFAGGPGAGLLSGPGHKAQSGVSGISFLWRGGSCAVTKAGSGAERAMVSGTGLGAFLGTGGKIRPGTSA